MSRKERIPVTIIGGYLGSGKTTLINNLLEQTKGVRIAILVNDFGELAIDANLIEAADEDIISLSGGCVCCSYGNDLSSALIKLQSVQPRPQHIIIEASGVALPGSIAGTLSLLANYQIQGIYVLADALSIMQNAKHKYLADTILRQLNDADLVLLNKIDLVTSENLSLLLQWLAEQLPNTQVIESTKYLMPIQVLFDSQVNNTSDESITPTSVATSEPTQTSPSEKNKENTTQAEGKNTIALASKPLSPNEIQKTQELPHTSTFDTCSFIEENPLNLSAFAKALSRPSAGVIRAKGFLFDVNSRMQTLQLIGQRFSLSEAPQNVKPGLICIGLSGQLNIDQIKADLKTCSLTADNPVQTVD